MTDRHSRRLDTELVARGLFSTRSRAREAVDAGLVWIDGLPAGKAAKTVHDRTVIEVRGRTNPYVSRGGLKLEHALEAFSLDVEGKSCLDVGSSTGGFTECLLNRGAASVTAVDVGRDQMHERLRTDARVILMESTDIRDVTPAMVAGPFDVAAVDVSFISLTKVLARVRALVAQGGHVVALIKPQFEAGPGVVGKKGVVRNRAAVDAAVGSVRDWALGLFEVRGLSPSPITGGTGNREVFIHLIGRDQGGACGGFHAELA